ncbi:uncharacterized protein LOC141902130 [Tubulanus polymorphus]|uniref:uncharacterized protein LOC141902130 n=1 Tax=Tubulanus polymorphus TaxID=672921 RepID=UPI003DA46112
MSEEQKQLLDSEKALINKKKTVRLNFNKSKNRLLDEIESISESKSNSNSLKKRLDELDEAFMAISELTTELSDIYISTSDDNKFQKLEEWFEQIENDYSNVSGTGAKILCQMKTPVTVQSDYPVSQQFNPVDVPMNPVDVPCPVSSSYTPPPPARSYDMTRDLERLPLPKFYGDKIEYEDWKDCFLTCVDEQPWSAKRKMLRLKSCLEGETKDIIRGLDNSEAAYRTALDRLDREYGGKRRMIAKHLEMIRETKPIQANNTRELRKFVNLIEVAIVALTNNGHNEELTDGMLHQTAKTKLPKSMLINYKRWIRDAAKDDILTNLRDWLIDEFRILSEVQEDVEGINKLGLHENQSVSQKNRYVKTFTKNTVSVNCIKCEQSHRLFECPAFKAMSVDNRWQFAKENQLCFRCLKQGHSGKICRFTRRCYVDGCKSNHNSLLHDRSTSKNVETNAKSVDRGNELSSTTVRPETLCVTEGDTPDTVNSASDSPVPNVSLRTLPVIVSNGEKKIEIVAVLDDCSTASYISEDIALKLGLQGQITDLNVDTIGSTKQTFSTMHVNFTVGSPNNRYSKNMNAYTVKRVSGYRPSVNWNNLKQKLNHLNDIRFPDVPKNARIELLIGLDAADLHRCLEERFGGDNEPIARRTPLGWTCVGKISNKTVITKHAYAYFVSAENIQLNEQLRLFWDLDSIGIRNKDNVALFTSDEKKAIEQTEKTRCFKDGRYEVGIPWRDQEPCFESNRETAFNRLKNLEKSLNNRPKVAIEYNRIIQNHLERGYIRKVPANEIASSPSEWYLPHFPVVKLQRTTSKVRIVFDAAAKHNGKCLNDAIYAGPNLQNDLINILIRFRRYAVALIGDLSEMFLQIGIREEDRRFHRFLWRDLDSSKDPEVYEFLRLTFGNTSSPYLAQDVVRYQAKTHKDMYPLASDTIENAMYMDDTLESVVSTEVGIQLRRELSDLFESAGFKMRKFCSNDLNVLADIPESDRAVDICIEEGVLPVMKTLGIMWQASTDAFTFKFEQPPSINMTKRDVLRKVATIFDPLQILAPYTVRAKMLLQRSWILGLDWDQPLPEELANEWKKWFSELVDVKNISVPRWLGLDSTNNVTLHTFVDASESAYAAISYCRREIAENVNVVMIAAKTRVSPTHALSIPRLELLAAVIGLRLANTVCKSLQIPISNHTFWSDSQNVLCWIRGESRKYKPFVAHRVGEIQESTTPDQWRYVPTEVNPADLATRGMTVKELVAENMWLNGPEFLLTDSTNWPKSKISPQSTTDLEIRKDKFVHVTAVAEPWLDAERYSELIRLKRITAWCLRFVKLLKSRVSLCCHGNDNRNNSVWTSNDNDCIKCSSIKNSMRRLPVRYLLVDELNIAENLWIRKAQNDEFSSEISDLQKLNRVSNNSKILKLNPKIDENGLLRVNGRLQHATYLSRDEREPIILPRHHPITRLIISSYHCELEHNGGVNHVLSNLTSRFWVIHGREAIKECEKNCNRCKLKRAKGAIQIMAPIPKVRVDAVSLRAFTHCGVDYGGPYFTKQGRGKTQTKRYMCLFTCLASRAVHIEMAWSLDTDSFLEAFSRMTYRRGKPKIVVSDNGTNFVSAERELRELIRSFDQEKIASKLADKGIQWKFNPPGAPHFGGIFEAMIKCAKRAVSAILVKSDICDEELLTALTAAEWMLNSRPLSYQTSDIKDESPLTPNHFLYGQACGDIVPTSVDLPPLHPRRRWYRVQQLISAVWKRFLSELLPSLNARQKWNINKEDFKIGDIVVCVDKNTPRGQWPLGRVTEIFPGSDGHVRVVRVKIGSKQYVRPVTKLYVLE